MANLTGVSTENAWDSTFAGCGVANFPAQGNNPSCTEPGCGISQVCSVMVDSSIGAPLQRLAALTAAQVISY